MRRVFVIGMVFLASILGAAAAYAENPNAKFLASLSSEQRGVYDAWRAAREAFDAQHDRYWSTIAVRKTQRRRKQSAGQPLTTNDYVSEHPPRYSGPKLRSDITRLMAAAEPPDPPGQEPRGLPTVGDFLDAARKHYRFIPRRTTEREFKRRYAAEALALGLAKHQVVRVYALETGGDGTYDMQAGFNPKTRKGRAISTALGYAQLLAANSIDVVVRHGDAFTARLQSMAAARGTSPQRAMELVAKADSLRSMMRVARSVPRQWRRHVTLSTTERGYGMHALNLDADIGPWLQVVKLKGLKDMAERAGRPSLSGSEIELMNLAGPRTGLDMMHPSARNASTANFFARRGFYRNTIVRWKSAPQLLAALDQKMDYTIKYDGAVEFATAFDEVAAAGNAGRRAAFAQPPPAAPNSAAVYRSRPTVAAAAGQSPAPETSRRAAITPEWKWTPFEMP